jgi:hypothetical protein
MKRLGFAAWSLPFGCLLALLATPSRAADNVLQKPAAAAAQSQVNKAAQANDTAVKPATAKFIRLDYSAADEPVALQTAIASFRATKPQQAGVTVDLIGAVHIAEKAYYESLNELFEKYDVVLYEMVAPAGTRIPKGGKAGNHPVSALQNGMKDMLGLEHQLAFIDYTKANLVHADMSPDRFAASMKERGESVWQMMFRAMGHNLAKQSKAGHKESASDLEILLTLFDKNRRGSLKRLMAEQFEDLDGMMAAVEGPEGSTLISERNKVALAELPRQIAAGKQHIAIFYGAAHLPDMQRRLQGDEFGMQRTGERWLTAWNLAEKK